jgi:hypothetical protein
MRWLISSRQRLLDELKEGTPSGYFPAHLPVMATWPREGAPPVSLTVKGMGLLPRPRLIPSYTRLFEETTAEASRTPWERSLPLRIEAHRRLYSSPAHFDRRVFGGLEIFGRTTFRNLRANPQASLLFFGQTHRGPRADYISFQFDGEVEILAPEDRHFRFLLAARKIFEFDKFHLPQPDYPWAYLFRIRNVQDKSPWIKESDAPRPEGKPRKKPAG